MRSCSLTRPVLTWLENLYPLATAAALAVTVMTALPGPAMATRVMPLRIETLMRQSVAIFIGTVRNSDPTCAGDRKPCTKVTFSDIEMVAGRMPERDVTFVLPEGVLDDGTNLRIVGTPRYVAGQRYLIFVRAGRWYLTPATNWFHSVFRELRVGPEGRTSVFVNHNGQAVMGVTEDGFRLGEQIAPRDESVQPPPSSDPNRARNGSSSSNPPRLSPQLRTALGNPDFDWSTLALPKDELVRQLRGLADKLGLAVNAELNLTSAGRGVTSDQETPDRGAPGLEPATAPTGEGRTPPSPELPDGSGTTRPGGEPPVTRPPSPGRGIHE